MSNATALTLNEQCWCVGTDLPALRSEIDELLRAQGVAESILTSHPHLFAGVPVFIAEEQLSLIREMVSAIYRVVAHPAWQAAALADALPVAQFTPGNNGAFLGIDFHLGEHGPQLIEINTNPGGALLNVLLGRAQQACCEPVARSFPDLHNFDDAEVALLALFDSEWRTGSTQERPLRRIAVLDESPRDQYLYPEFLLYQQALGRRGLPTVIVAPEALSFVGGRLLANGEPVDMVYNRLTDFALRDQRLEPLRAAYVEGAVVLTPHPRAHALFANKRNLVWLSDDQYLTALGIDSATRALLRQCVPRTQLVTADQAEYFWAERRSLFFKPLEGYASKGAYRGDKLTRKVFAEIAAGGYVAQSVVPPSERVIANNDVLADTDVNAADGARAAGSATSAAAMNPERSAVARVKVAPMKVDVRAYAYAGEVLLLAARLYRGQTTNFRTQGGGFAPVLRAYEGCGCSA